MLFQQTQIQQNAAIYQVIEMGVGANTDILYNTRLAVQGELAHCLQCHTRKKIKNGRQSPRKAKDTPTATSLHVS